MRIVGAQDSRSLGRTFDREEPCLMVVHCHYHVERRGFDRGGFLHHIHRSGRHFHTLEKLPKLRDVFGCQLFSMRLMNDMSVPTDRKQKSAIRLPMGRTEPIDEMQNVGPRKIAGTWMPEYRLQHTSVPIKNPMRCRHVWLSLASERRCVVCDDDVKHRRLSGLVRREVAAMRRWRAADTEIGLDCIYGSVILHARELVRGRSGGSWSLSLSTLACIPSNSSVFIRRLDW